MIDSRLALLGTTANPGAAVQQYQAGKLNNLLGQAKLDQIPIENAQAQQKIDVSKRNADIDEQKLILDIRKQMANESDASIKEGVRVAGLVSQVQSPEDWAALVAQNPKDLGPLSSVQYGTPEFEKVRRASEIMVRAANPDNTLVEIADPTSPTGTRMVPRADAINQPGKPPSGTNLTVGPDGTVQLTQGRGVTQGNEPLAKPQQNAVQGDIIATEESLARLENIGAEYQRGYLTYAGKYGAQLSAIKDKANIDLSQEEKDFLKGRTRFTMQINREFNLYRKLITGAAAAEKELNDLKKATINEDLSPAQFEAAFDVYKEELQRGLRLKRKLLREGIDVGSKEFGDVYDNAFLSGTDDDSDVRMQELMADGLTQEQAVDKLIQEGYQ